MIDILATAVDVAVDVAEYPAEFEGKAIAPKEGVNAPICLLPEAEEIAARLNAPDATPEEDLETLDQLVTIFRRTNDGANPSGG